MEVKKVQEFSAVLPHAALDGADWADGWKVLVSKPFVDARQAAGAVVAAFPKWTYPLLALRQVAVLPLGLKGAGASHGTSDMIGIFPVAREWPGRLVAGFDDKHLDFRIVVETESLCDQYTAVRMMTLVKRHNLLGRVYLAAVMPFHKLILATILSRIGG